MAFELAKAYISIDTNAGRVGTELNSLQKKVESSVSSIGSAASKMWGGFVVTMGDVSRAFQSVIGMFERWGAAAKEAEMAERRINAVLKATGGSVGITTEELRRYASQLQAVTVHEDDEITNAMAKLATFRSVQGNTFREATKLSLDLADTGFGSVESAAVMLGKALEDPVRGLTALRRVGVSFSAEQQRVIKSLVEQNQLWKAQQLILKGVEIQVGGVAEALGETAAGKIEILKNSIADLNEELGKQGVAWETWRLKLERELKKLLLDITEFAIQAAKDTSSMLRAGLTRAEEVKLLESAIRIAEKQRGAATNVWEMRRWDSEIALLRREMGVVMGTRKPGELGLNLPNVAGLPPLPGRKMLFPDVEQAWKEWKDLRDVGLGPRGPSQLPNKLVELLGGAVGGAMSLAVQKMRRGIMAFPPPLFGMGKAGAAREGGIGPWNRFMGADEVNRAMQEAMLDNQNPVLETNRILEQQVVKGLGVVAGAMNGAADAMATKISQLVPGLIKGGLNLLTANE